MLQQAAQSQISNITNKKSSVNKEILIPDPPGFANRPPVGPQPGLIVRFASRASFCPAFRGTYL
jgi:hypothetical protein